jgi:predicted alpha/beta superfamily hydrolase
MTKLIQLALLLVCISCKQTIDNTLSEQPKTLNQTFKLYSKTAEDTFYISVNLPDSFYLKPKATYPVIYVLDGNNNFEILKTIGKKYSEFEILPQMIIVGVGYKDNPTLMRQRLDDLTYPKCILPLFDSLELGGGAEGFYSFMVNDLSPLIDKTYQVDTTNRILFGHSLSGYFSCYALLKALEGHSVYSSFIAADPSISIVGDQYIPKQFQSKQFPKRTSKLKLYLSCQGALPYDSISYTVHHHEIVKQFSENVMLKDSDKVAVNYEMLQHVCHEDIAWISYINALRFVFNRPSN